MDSHNSIMRYIPPLDRGICKNGGLIVLISRRVGQDRRDILKTNLIW
jgi:hypothetical protein